jgi:hypothetical protein
MPKSSSSERQRWHEIGQHDAKEGRDGNPLRGPWRGPFESSERYDERNEAYESGKKNYYDTTK